MGAKNLREAFDEFANWRRNLNVHNRSGSKCFSEMLFDLINKADPGNLSALRRAFGMEVAVFEEWRNAPTEIEFYKKFNFQER